MNEQKTVLQAYERALKKLPGSREKNTAYRDYIRTCITDAFAERPDAGASRIRELLGSPEAVREAYIQSLSEEESDAGRRERKRARNRRLLVVAPLCVLLIAVGALFVSARFFPKTTVLIARPVEKDAERYLEYPTLVTPGGIFGESARSLLRERQFIDNVFFLKQKMEQRYPARHHITCAASVEDRSTVIRWTGTGVTAEGVTEEVQEEYAFPYRYRIQEPTTLSGLAEERARQAMEATRKTVEATG